MINDYFEPLTPERRRAIYEECGTSEEMIKNDVEHLKQWLKKQEHLPNLEDEDILHNLLMRYKMSLEKTKYSLEAYFTFRVEYDELLFAADSEDWLSRDDVRKFFDMRFHGLYLPKLTAEGYRVVVNRTSENQTDQTKNVHIAATLWLFSYFAALKQDMNNGLIVISDCKGIQMWHSIYLMSKLPIVGHLLKFISPKIRKIYVVNLSPLSQQLLNLIIGLVNKTTREKIVVWDRKIEELAQEIPGNVLPTIYGGTGNSLEDLNDRYYAHLEKNRKVLFELSQLKALNKTPVNSETGVEMAEFGVNGSFRQLALE